MIAPALLLAALAVPLPSGGEEEPPLPPYRAPAPTPPPPVPPVEAPPPPVFPLDAAPPTPLLEPTPPEPTREPEPCRAQTGSTLATPCLAAPDTPPDPTQPRTRREESDGEEPRGGLVGWADTRHDQMEEGLTALVHRVDGFFGDPSHLQFNPPAFSARLRSGFRTGQDRAFHDESSVLADLRLPSLDRALSRARLFLTGGEDDAQVQSGTEQDLVPRRFGSLGTSRGALELRFDLLRARRSLVDLGGGVRFRWLPTPYARLRGAHAEDLGLGLVGHVNQTGFWERSVGFGESTRVDVERVIGPRTIARTWAIGTLHEKSRGLEWAAEVGLAQGLGVRNGLYVAGAVDGATRPVAQVDRYRLFTRLRRDVHDAWLYLEAEPEVSWPLEADGTRPRTLAVTFRLEIQLATRKR